MTKHKITVELEVDFKSGIYLSTQLGTINFVDGDKSNGRVKDNKLEVADALTRYIISGTIDGKYQSVAVSCKPVIDAVVMLMLDPPDPMDNPKQNPNNTPLSQNSKGDQHGQD